MSSNTISRRTLIGGTLGGVFGLTVLGLTGCAPSANSGASTGSSTGSAKTTLVYAFTGGGRVVDPTESADTTGNAIVRATYDQLIKYKVVGGAVVAGQYEPMLAKSWSTSSDGLVWTFKLRDDVTFQSGNKMTAADVVFSIIRKKTALSHTLFFLANIGDVVAVDDLTAEVHLTAPQPLLLDYLAIHNFSIQDSKTIQAAGGAPADYLKAKTAGSGPYLLESWDPTTQAVLTANPNYWGPKPKIKKVVLQFIPEMSTQISQVKQGDIDVVYGVPTGNYDELKGVTSLTVSEFPSNIAWFLGLNNKVAPFDNPDLRRAIAYAIPYDDLVKTVLDGHGKADRSLEPPTMPYYDASVNPYKLDLDKAKSLLQSSGHSGLSFTLAVDSSEQPAVDAAALIQASLKKIGVDMQIQQVADQQFVTNLKGLQVPAFIYQASSYVNSPAYHLAFLAQTGGGWNYAAYSNPQVDALIKSTSALTDDAKEKAGWSQVQKLIADDAPYLNLFMDDTILASTKSLKGYVQYGDALPRFGDLYFA